MRCKTTRRRLSNHRAAEEQGSFILKRTRLPGHHHLKSRALGNYISSTGQASDSTEALMQRKFPGPAILLTLVSGSACFLAGCGSSSGGGVPQQVATHLSVVAQNSAVAGAAVSVTVTALDASNNIVSTYSGTV